MQRGLQATFLTVYRKKITLHFAAHMLESQLTLLNQETINCIGATVEVWFDYNNFTWFQLWAPYANFGLLLITSNIHLLITFIRRQGGLCNAGLLYATKAKDVM